MITSCSYEPRHDKTDKMSVRPAKTQISLGIHPVWSESSLCAEWIAKDQSFLHADSEDSDQTGRMPRLIWDFAGRTLSLLVLSCRGSYVWFMWKLKINIGASSPCRWMALCCPSSELVTNPSIGISDFFNYLIGFHDYDHAWLRNYHKM